MLCVVELLDIQGVRFKLDDCSFVIVDITVIRCRENSYDNREFLSTIPLVHLVAIKLSLVRPQNREQFVLGKELICSTLTEEVGTTSDIIHLELLWTMTFVIFHWV